MAAQLCFDNITSAALWVRLCASHWLTWWQLHSTLAVEVSSPTWLYSSQCTELNTNIILVSSIINPWFITGFSDGESSFTASISRNNKSKLGWTIGLSYIIYLSIRDVRLLEQIKLYFNVGSITYKLDKGLVMYRVRSLKELALIIKFFQKYPLLTSKRHDFNLFVVLYEIILKKEHLTVSGFLKSISIINNLNNPTNSDLIDEITLKWGMLPPLLLPPVTILKNINFLYRPWWIIGFICGEASFTYGASSYTTKKSGIKIKYQLFFELAQKTKDIYILEAVLNYLGSGTIYSENRGISKLKIGNIQSIQHVLIPFLLTYPLIGFKKLQFDIWIKAVQIKMIKNVQKSNLNLNQEILLKNYLRELTELRK